MNHRLPTEVLGISMENPPEENWRRMEVLWRDDDEGATLRRRFEDQLATQTMEFNEHAVEFGFMYSSDVLAPDTPAAPLDPIHVHVPSTRPGSPLPHAYVTRDGRQVALRDLPEPGEFLLITGEAGEPWCEAAAAIGDVPLRAIQVAPHTGDWLDLRFDWLRSREVSAAGAVLVRPDRVVAWRSVDAVPDPEAAIRDALAVALG